MTVQLPAWLLVVLLATAAAGGCVALRILVRLLARRGVGRG